MTILIGLVLASLCSLAHTKSAIAVINNAGVSGTVRFSQETAEDDVLIDVDLTGLAERAGGYHVHELPVNFGGSGFQFNSFDDLGCGFDITADHFNPLLVQGGANNKEAGPYRCSEGQEFCEAGDISGKHGSLSGLTELQGTFVDGVSGLTLFGKDSIIGRSMVIHRTDGSRLLCANVFEEETNYKKVVATFDRESSGLEGTVTFLQSVDSPQDTHMFLNLALGDEFPSEEGSVSFTLNSYPVLDVRNNNKFSRCSERSVGSVSFDFDFEVSLSKGTRTKVLRTIPSGLSLADKSLVVQSNSQTVDCTVLGKLARVEFTENGVAGDIIFRQTSEQDPVSVTVTLSGLEGRANNYHVHNLPVFEDCLSTTGHYNPLGVEGGDGVPGEYKCSSADPELCEAGDLSGRFGGLLGRNEASYTFVDFAAGLTLFGTNSIVGRSVVIHGEDGPSRLVCANIEEIGRVNGQRAVFVNSVNAVEGFVELLQRSVDPDAETTVTFDIKKVNEVPSVRHMFHIHEAPVSDSNDCSETKAHFSPSGVNGGAGQASFDYRCEEGPEFCEIGDISGKHGLADLPNRFVVTDATIPLSNIFSISGLSITFHDEEKAPGRIDCANLEGFARTVDDLGTGVVPGNPGDQDSNSEESRSAIVTTILFVLSTVILALYAFQIRSKYKKAEERLSRLSLIEESVNAQAQQATL